MKSKRTDETYLQAKSVLVIGAGKGLGRAVALAFAKEGCDLLLVSRTQEDLDSIAAEVSGYTKRPSVVCADVSKDEDLLTVKSKARDVFPQVDIIVNCAAASLLKALPDISREDWNRTMDGTLRAIFLPMQEFLPAMMQRGSGQIINISSRDAHAHSVRACVYGAAKAGVSYLSTAWGREARSKGVKVLAIEPGAIDTPRRWSSTPEYDRKRVLSPLVVADLIIWIASHPELTFESEIVPISIRY